MEETHKNGHVDRTPPARRIYLNANTFDVYKIIREHRKTEPEKEELIDVASKIEDDLDRNEYNKGLRDDKKEIINNLVIQLSNGDDDNIQEETEKYISVIRNRHRGRLNSYIKHLRVTFSELKS